MRDAKANNWVSRGTAQRLLLGASVLVILGLIQWFTPRHVDLWWQSFLEFLHAPLFGLIAVALIAMTPTAWHWRNRLLVTLASVLALSLISEGAQMPLPNRNASLNDLVNDWLGALAFLSAAAAFSPNFHVPPGRGRYLLLLAAILMLFPLRPLATTSFAYWDRFEQLPSIVPLQSRTGRMFYDLRNAFVLFREEPGGRLASEIRFAKQGSSSIKFHDPWSDWSSYGVLLLDIELPGEAALPLTIRIHDKNHLRGDQPHHDRFNRRFQIQPGRHVIPIDLRDVETAPADRLMDMRRIDGVAIFGSEREAGARLIIHDIRLE